MNSHVSSTLAALAATALFSLAAGSVHAQSKGVVVEQIVARVNNQIVTLSDYQRAQQELVQEVAQDCQGCSQDRIQTLAKDREKNLLRDMIDQQLLIERAKDMDISVEADLTKRLDEVRKQNKLATLEDLEKAVESQGGSWEDYKTQMRNTLLTQEVIRREVGGRMDIPSEEVRKYYEEHKDQFNRPEEVALAEIFLSTEDKSPEEIEAVRTRAEDLRSRLVKGEDFVQLAKRYSTGSTADEGGELGVYERGQLSKQIEDAVFSLEKGQYSAVIQTKTGFEVLKVLDHYQAGLQPLDKVEGEITNRLYQERMEPALRTYLAQLREESYVTVKPGYTDAAAVGAESAIEEVAPTPDAAEKQQSKKKHKLHL